MSEIRQQILHNIDSFCSEVGISHDAFSRRSTGDNKAVSKLRSGTGVTLTRLEVIERYIASERRRRQQDQDAQAA